MHHRFFTATAGLLLGITLIGFSPSFFLKFVFEHPGGIVEQAELLRRDGGGSGVRVPGLPVHVVAHGVLAAAWMSLFFAQTLLIASGRRKLHRTLGIGGLWVSNSEFGR